MDGVWAEEYMRDGRAAALNAKAFKELVFMATGSEDEANRAFSQRALDKMCQ